MVENIMLDTTALVTSQRGLGERAGQYIHVHATVGNNTQRTTRNPEESMPILENINWVNMAVMMFDVTSTYISCAFTSGSLPLPVAKRLLQEED